MQRDGWEGVTGVLVVDDQEDIREVVRMSLESLREVRVFTACNGVEGVQLARTVRPVAILLDWSMPEMDGPTALRTLRQQGETRDIPVVALTARPDEMKSVDGLRGVIAKPFDAALLPAQMEEILGWPLGSEPRA
ncbi:MAG: response regulator [Myxococcota bacterium]